jgi:hypothetical protein
MDGAGAPAPRSVDRLSPAGRGSAVGFSSRRATSTAAYGGRAGAERPDATIAVKPWDPATPYLAALKAAAKSDRYKVYLEQRKTYAASPAFFVDCADFFLREGDALHGVRVLTNLAELKLEEAALLRVLAWRLQQAGELDRAIVILRKVGKLRPEEPQSLRDLALALAERGKTRRAANDLTEAMSLLEKLVMGEWQRFEEIEVIALEELNALIAWTKHHAWAESAKVPALDSRLLKNLDVDVRIAMSWDADSTDVDLHVLEPSGEEAFYSHNRTTIGGLVSRDFTQGYGPEEYMVRRAQPGSYRIFAHYYGSNQQTVMGAATITATVFTDFGRPTEKKQVLTLRLDKPREKADIGEITVGGKDTQVKEGKRDSSKPEGRDAFRALRVGQTKEQVKRLVGEPQIESALPDAKAGEETWLYRLGDRQYRVKFSKGNHLLSVVELLPGGAEMILVQ